MSELYRVVVFSFITRTWDSIAENLTWSRAKEIRADWPEAATVKMTWLPGDSRRASWLQEK